MKHDYNGSFHMRPWRWDYFSLTHSLRRSYNLFEMPGGEEINEGIAPLYGMGRDRSLASWLELVGMDFTTRTVFEHRQCDYSMSSSLDSTQELRQVDQSAHRRPYMLPVFGSMVRRKIDVVCATFYFVFDFFLSFSNSSHPSSRIRMRASH